MSKLEALAHGFNTGVGISVDPIGYRERPYTGTRPGYRTLGDMLGSATAAVGMYFPAKFAAPYVAPHLPSWLAAGGSAMFSYIGKGLAYVGLPNVYATTAAATLATATIVGMLAIPFAFGIYHAARGIARMFKNPSPRRAPARAHRAPVHDPAPRAAPAAAPAHHLAPNH